MADPALATMIDTMRTLTLGRAPMPELPRVLQQWVDVDPNWRIVKLEHRPDRGCHLLSIIHVVDGPDLFHGSEVEVMDPMNSEEVREAVLDVLDDFGKAYG